MNKKKELSLVKEKPQKNIQLSQVDDKMKYLYSLSGNFTVS